MAQTILLWLALARLRRCESGCDGQGTRMNQVRVGVIGAGAVAARHVASLRRLDDVNVVAVADPLMERALALADVADATAFSDIDALIAEVDIDAAYVCVPPFAH